MLESNRGAMRLLARRELSSPWRVRRDALAGVVLLLAVGCTGGVRVFDVPDAALPDAGDPRCSGPALTFERHVLSSDFLAEGIAVADLDDDGALDIITVPYWWSGPAFTTRHEVATPRAVPLDPMTEYGSVYGVYPSDVDDDGCIDIVVAPRESDAETLWYRNPRRIADSRCGDPDTHWSPFSIVPPGLDGTLESPMVADLFDDGASELIMGEGASRTLGWWAPGSDPTMPWELHPISAAGFAGAASGTHGIGVGDVNDDGRRDVLSPFAWFEQTADRAVWRTHPFDPALLLATDASRTCSSMSTYDVNGDSLPDVICGRPHQFGLYWWRQMPGGAAAEPTFVAQLVDDRTTAALHSLRLEDLDGDAVPEIITGKRWFAHLAPGDPGQFDDPLLLYYSLGRDASGPYFCPNVIDRDSGVGIQFAVADLNDDGRPDIVTASKKGVFYFLQG